MEINIQNGAVGGNYGFQYKDGKILMFNCKKNSSGEPTFYITLQDKSGKILDSLEVTSPPGHEYIKVVT